MLRFAYRSFIQQKEKFTNKKNLLQILSDLEPLYESSL